MVKTIIFNRPTIDYAKKAALSTKLSAAPHTPSPALLAIRDCLLQLRNRQDLLYLYEQSQREHQRQGRLSMEIGNSREKDLLAILFRELGPALQVDLPNHLPYDCYYQSSSSGEKISIKHITGVCGRQSFKLKWTADGNRAQEYIQSEIARCQIGCEAPPHQLLVYFDLPAKRIDLVGISGAVLAAQIREWGPAAFTARQGTNQRGVELSLPALQTLLYTPAFHLIWREVELSPKETLSPIERRLQLLACQRLPPQAASTERLTALNQKD